MKSPGVTQGTATSELSLLQHSKLYFHPSFFAFRKPPEKPKHGAPLFQKNLSLAIARTPFLGDTEIKYSLPADFLLAEDMQVLAEL